jgi:hypothetical protein
MKEDLLLKVKRVIVHGNCPDGMASAMFLYNALGIEPEFLIHGRDEYINLEAEPGMLFCDITPPALRYQEFIDAGAIVLDHHKKAESIVKAFGERGVFADEEQDPGVSGAVLAFREVWKPLVSDTKTPYQLSNAESIAKLIGIADTWQDKSPLWDDAGHLVAAVMFYPWEYWRRHVGNSDCLWAFDKEIMIGQMIFTDRLTQAEKCAKEAYKFEHAGYNVAVFNDLAKLSSDVAQVLRGQGYNVIAGFKYSKQNDNSPMPIICFSLRSDGKISVSDFACTFDEGGGGHTLAAGFSMEMDERDTNPFVAFKNLFKDYIFLKGDDI